MLSNDVVHVKFNVMKEMNKKEMTADSFFYKLTLISILLIMTIFFSACAYKEEEIKEEQNNQMGTGQQKNELERYKEFFGSTKELSILATDLWETDPTLHDESGLSLYNEAYQSYLITLTDEKNAFPEGMSIDLYSELTTSAVIKDMKEAAVTEKGSVDVDGLGGKKFYVEGLIDGISVTYIFLILENDVNYVQVILWSFTENIENNSDYYDDLIESVKVHEVERED